MPGYLFGTWWVYTLGVPGYLHGLFSTWYGYILGVPGYLFGIWWVGYPGTYTVYLVPGRVYTLGVPPGYLFGTWWVYTLGVPGYLHGVFSTW